LARGERSRSTVGPSISWCLNVSDPAPGLEPVLDGSGGGVEERVLDVRMKGCEIGL
jgi:hypothetical protein